MVAVFLSILVFVFLAGGASVQEKDWEKQWTQTIAGARKEGEGITKVQARSDSKTSLPIRARKEK